ncbi:MAG: hypothetical protein QXR45_07110 [Candidatus Bathyarchaeia archaeon]
MKVETTKAEIYVETDFLKTTIRTEGYVSGVASLIDKSTGARDLGFGLDIVDFLLEPGDDRNLPIPEEYRYRWGDKIHGNIPKRFVELPQICTQAKRLPFEIFRGRNFVAIKQWFKFTIATLDRLPGSLWEQWLIFQNGRRFFISCDKITSANDVDSLILRIDMPGHIKHNRGDTFESIYLSYYGFIPAIEFLEDFPPDARFFYRRGVNQQPQRFIRAYKIRGGPWLAGMTLNPSIVYESWCHQRGYVCMIQEIGGYPVRKTESFSAVHIIGFFNSVEEMNKLYDAYRECNSTVLCENGYRLI